MFPLCLSHAIRRGLLLRPGPLVQRHVDLSVPFLLLRYLDRVGPDPRRVQRGTRYVAAFLRGSVSTKQSLSRRPRRALVLLVRQVLLLYPRVNRACLGIRGRVLEHNWMHETCVDGTRLGTQMDPRLERKSGRRLFSRRRGQCSQAAGAAVSLLLDDAHVVCLALVLALEKTEFSVGYLDLKGQLDSFGLTYYIRVMRVRD